MARKRAFPVLCPCGSQTLYTECCCPYHLEKIFPPTAEGLMRSRFSAYVLGKADYLLFSWHPETRPSEFALDVQRVKWVGLTIISTELGGVNDSEGVVKFIARYKIGGRAATLAETSRFVRFNGQWKYIDGVIDQECVK